MANSFDIDLFQKHLTTKHIGKQFFYQDVTGSTMDDARELAISEPGNYSHGTVVMAERQTKARGARDHKWDASNTGNIYISIVLHLPQKFKTFEGRFELEVIACLAVMKVAHKFGVKCAIPKWPNDIWVSGHKLSGNLVEDSRFNIPGTPHCLLILGMGINVNADIRRNAELHSIATSMICERNGKPCDREIFFAEVCLALEENLAEPRNTILQNFREENLFQKGCEISVTCQSEGKVINGEFLEICDNWEVSFMDKRTKEVLSGRSDYYTIRPKVMRKILVVFTGATGSKSASIVSRWLTSLVDTSKFVVCLVPESIVRDADEWMKTCDLLVLVEDICDPTHLTSKLKSYLNRGGKIFAAGVAALFVAKFMEIPYKECVLESSSSNADVSLVYLEYANPQTQVDALSSLTPQKAVPVAFLASPTCFKFSQNYLKVVKEGASTGTTASSMLRTSQGGDFASLSLNESTDKSKNGSVSNMSNFILRYSLDEDPDFNVAMFSRPTTSAGMISLFGFDIGVVFPSSGSRNRAGSQDSQKNVAAETESKADDEVQRLSDDRFQRDEIMLQMLKNLNP